MRKTFLTRRCLSLLLALTMCLPMCLSMVPAAAAADTGPSIKLNETELIFHNHEGYQETGSLGATARKSDGTSVISTEITWTSQDPAIATVDQTGGVTGVGMGVTTITGSFVDIDGQTYSAACTVKVYVVDHIKVDIDELRLKVGEKKKPGITFTVYHTLDGVTLEERTSKNEPLTPTNWSVSNYQVADVDAYGNVTGQAPGECDITFKVKYFGKEATARGKVYVEAQPPALTALTVTLTSSVTMTKGSDRQLTATVTPTPANADISAITYDWQTGSGGVAAVSGSGSTATVTAVGKGSTNVTVTARCGGVTSNTAACAVTVEEQMTGLRLSPTGPLTLEKGNSQQVKAIGNSGTGTESDMTSEAVWTSSDESVVTVTRGSVYARGPGEAKITAVVGTGSNRKEASLQVEVSGVVLRETVDGVDQVCTTIKLEENDSVEAPRTDLYGAAKGKTVSWQSLNTDVAEYSGSRIVGRGPGKTTLTAFVSGGIYEASVTVEVEADPESTIDLTDDPIKVTDLLNFSDLKSDFRLQAGGRLSHLTGMRVDTSMGTLYYNYHSEAEPGQGVAQAENFYLTPGIGQKDLSKVTFVPKPDFTGGTVVIYYTAVSDRYENYSCRILLTVKPKGSASALSLSTGYNTPVRFSGAEFDRVCQELHGVSLSSVTFTQPAQRQGTLYTNYVSASNYGSIVSTNRQYTRKELDDIWFVPAPGVSNSTVTVYYTARGAGSSSAIYSGQISIYVRDSSAISVGGPVYNTANGGAISFDDRDFEDYRQQVLPGGDTLSSIQFDYLPDSSQGTLYYDYRSASSTGSRVTAGTDYFYGTRAPRLERIVFVPASDFTGTIRLPFTAWDKDGNRFSGRVEINVRGSSGTGDIRYTCSPGRSVSFLNSDFTSLCRDLTGRTLNYIIFQELPDRYDEGSIYHNTNSRVSSTGTRYYANTSNSNRISRLSFKAASGFFGTVDIPFVGYASNGDSFDGVISISSSGVTDWTIRYTTPSNGAAKFDREDFDSLSQWDSREDISSVRFSIPSTSQGDLYRNYRSTTSKGTRISSSSTSISASSLNQVAFVPNKNFMGTAYIDFTATSKGGGTFTGTVEVVVDRAAADATASYYTRTVPVHFDSQDFREGTRTLRSIKFDSLPSSDMGYLYYQYSSPMRHGSRAAAGTVYNASGRDSLISELTFVPRAGYTGTVVIPYTGTNSNGTTFDGEVLINVSPVYGSSYFNDMSGYSDDQRAAVDFCREIGVTDGMGPSQFGPEYSIRRGDFAKMVYQAFELNPTSNRGVFHDVPDSAYYAQAVNTLYALDIVGGVGGGYFNPEGTLTRQDAVCMIQRTMRAVGMDSYDGNANYLYNYLDGSAVGGYAQGAMSFAMQKGYLPVSGGRLEPHQPLTRVDMAQMIHRVLTY